MVSALIQTMGEYKQKYNLESFSKKFVYLFAVFFLVAVFAFGFFVYVLSPEQVITNQKKEWGVYAGGGQLRQFEKEVGKKPDMYAFFMGWNEPFPTDFASELSVGQSLVIFWEQYEVSLDEILSGKTDEYIRQFAGEAKLYGNKVIMVPLHEMNGDWSPWSGVVGNNNAEKVILAFRHLHNVFSEAENKNVKWAWAVNHESLPDVEGNQIEDYYPGDEYVDYVGVDGFNFDEPWMTFSEIFSNSLLKLEKYEKPIYIFSMASAEGPKKAEWIKDALYKINSDTRIKGFIWFNENKEKNWLINSDQASLKAFKEGIK